MATSETTYFIDDLGRCKVVPVELELETYQLLSDFIIYVL
jgi:hypothetical protein